jgi:integrase
VADLRARFQEHHEGVLKSAVRTLARYAAATRHLENFARERQIDDARTVSAAPFIAYLREIEVSPNGHANTARRKLADKGIRYIAETCRSMYHFGVNFGVLPPGTPNPFSRRSSIPIRVRDAKPIFVFDAIRELAFLTAARPWSFAVHFTLAKTGLRPGELVHLLIEDVDLQDGWLVVRGKPELGWTTKTNNQRRVPLLPEVAAVLRQLAGDWRSGVLFLRERLATPGSEAPSLSGTRAELAAEARRRLAEARDRAGRPLTRREEARVYERVWADAGAVPVDRVRTSFIRTAGAAGIANATCPKSWRHTFATLLQQANVDLLVRQETLGHRPAAAHASALGMTGVYTHTTADFQRSEIERALRLRPDSLALTGQHGLQRPTGGS